MEQGNNVSCIIRSANSLVTNWQGWRSCSFRRQLQHHAAGSSPCHVWSSFDIAASGAAGVSLALDTLLLDTQSCRNQSDATKILEHSHKRERHATGTNAKNRSATVSTSGASGITRMADFVSR